MWYASEEKKRRPTNRSDVIRKIKCSMRTQSKTRFLRSNHFDGKKNNRQACLLFWVIELKKKRFLCCLFALDQSIDWERRMNKILSRERKTTTSPCRIDEEIMSKWLIDQTTRRKYPSYQYSQWEIYFVINKKIFQENKTGKKRRTSDLLFSFGAKFYNLST